MNKGSWLRQIVEGAIVAVLRLIDRARGIK